MNLNFRIIVVKYGKCWQGNFKFLGQKYQPAISIKCQRWVQAGNNIFTGADAEPSTQFVSQQCCRRVEGNVLRMPEKNGKWIISITMYKFRDCLTPKLKLWPKWNQIIMNSYLASFRRLRLSESKPTHFFIRDQWGCRHVSSGRPLWFPSVKTGLVICLLRRLWSPPPLRSLYWYHGTELRRPLIRLVALLCTSKLVSQLLLFFFFSSFTFPPWWECLCDNHTDAADKGNYDVSVWEGDTAGQRS